MPPLGIDPHKTPQWVNAIALLGLVLLIAGFVWPHFPPSWKLAPALGFGSLTMGVLVIFGAIYLEHRHKSRVERG